MSNHEQLLEEGLHEDDEDTDDDVYEDFYEEDSGDEEEEDDDDDGDGDGDDDPFPENTLPVTNMDVGGSDEFTTSEITEYDERRSSTSLSMSHDDNRRGSLKSAPDDRKCITSLSPDKDILDAKLQKRVSISVPNEITDNDNADRRASHRVVSRRRQSIYSVASSIATSVDGSSDLEALIEESTDSSNTRMSLMYKKRKSARRSNISGDRRTVRVGGGSGSGGPGSVFTSIDSAMANLGQGGNEWQNVAAAAAVVAGSSVAGGTRSHVQFSVNDKVLVFLNILNLTNSSDNHDDFTINPVNKFGFPEGLGKTDEERQGPYSYVLATVQRVHFDEDVRYYTVVRADSGTEQRADTEWMQQLKSREGQEAALAAAKQTKRAMSSRNEVVGEGSQFLRSISSWPHRFATKTVIPFYRRARQGAKVQIAHILFGDSPYAFNIRLTGINLLVVCSCIYLFEETIQYAFFPSTWDHGMRILSIISWAILLLELFFEWLIRPSAYFDLISSDKAFAPSTARHIDRYHLIMESIALIMFFPRLACIKPGDCAGCHTNCCLLTNMDSTLRAVLGPTHGDALLGRLILGMYGFRLVGLVRHWKQMWVGLTLSDDLKGSRYGTMGSIFAHLRHYYRGGNELDKAKGEDDDTENAYGQTVKEVDDDQGLKKAATIGTALMIVNSKRFLVLLVIIMIVFPSLLVLEGQNNVAPNMTKLLQISNSLSYSFGNNTEDCEYLGNFVVGWLQSLGEVRTSNSGFVAQDTRLLFAEVIPSRCEDFQFDNGNFTGVITSEQSLPCRDNMTLSQACEVWGFDLSGVSSEELPDFYAEMLDIRVGGILDVVSEYEVNGTLVHVRALYNNNNTVSLSNFTLFLWLGSLLILTIMGLSVLRGDAACLVLDPLQNMLKIVVRYAENPLASTVRRNDNDNEPGKGEAEIVADKEQLGNYETEQLINAITKIADLLRKCWGVAGAGIISSNLARTQDGKTVVFNPTVPGKQVYALFGFVGINGFSDQLHALDQDVMILINDVAKVVHDEVFRWAMGDSGQCNKNLGSTFLMVFRIGDFTSVHERKKRATDVVFDSKEKGKGKRSLTKSLRRRGLHRRTSIRTTIRERPRSRPMEDDTLQLSTLPGIRSFTDRALLGMLKSFASLHRDREVQKWRKDFRLGAGVGVFEVEIMIGMDAGWAVEGAVGSEYKIDATYLSPHVNMCARMMTASRQYGVTILISQAVEELLSTQARSKLRHLDTVFVKGSQVRQRIFTYDARYQGVDFFLFEKSEEQADFDAENYSPNIWDQDQDLIAMRQHVTEEFTKKFEEGKNQYLAGNWKAAIKTLKKANDILIANVLEEGYVHYSPEETDPDIFDRESDEEIARIRKDLGDGACNILISYMEKRGGVAPSSWEGVRPLTSK